LLGFKHVAEEAHKAENNKNKQKIDENWHPLSESDLEGISEGFWEGFGRPKSMIFAFFSMFFRSKILIGTWKGKKSNKKATRGI